MEYACEKGSDGSTVSVEVGNGKISGYKVPETGSWGDFKIVSLGTIECPAAGPVHAAVTVQEKPGYAVMNLRLIVLKPVK
jgi:hypothetical protein